MQTVHWDGKDRVLRAYRSREDGICYSFAPGTAGGSSDSSTGLTCGPVEGIDGGVVPGSFEHRISSASIGCDAEPHYVVGPVVGRATTVVLHLYGGTVIRARTIEPPPGLDAKAHRLAP